MKSINDRINDTKTLNELDALQNEINEMFDTRRRVLNLVSEAKEMGKKSFGYLKESFENLSPKLFKSDEGKAVMNKYTGTIRENKSLSALHKLYENIRQAHSGIDFDYFVGTLCETQWNVKAKVNEGIQKLASVVAEGYIVVGEGASKYLGTENDRLDGAIEFIAENKVGQKNIVKYSEAVKIIREAVEKNGNIADSFKKETDLDKTIEDLVAKYSKDDYSDEEEKDAILQNQIARSGDEETVFVNKKTDCLKNLDEAIKKYGDGEHEDELSTLKKIHEQVSAKSYNPETIGPDICNFVEMSKLFE